MKDRADADRAHHEALELIEDAHEHLEELLEALAGSVRGEARGPGSPRPRLLDRVASEFSSHLEIEEHFLYRKLDGAEPEVRTALDQHEHLHRLVGELGDLSPDTPVWARRVRSLKWSAELHFQYEEEEIFELVRNTVDRTDAIDLANALRRTAARDRGRRVGPRGGM